jgi:acetaldehyde dehydrogenase (acetylating)
MSIHSRSDQIVLEFGLRKPAFRICVNTPTTHGSIGWTTGLDPAMTLGCGGYGGNITSDNISPRHLLNIKRVAYEITPAQPSTDRRPPSPASASGDPPLPQAPAVPSPAGISAASLTARIDEFLTSRGYRGDSRHTPSPTPDPEVTCPAEFVCEEDVRTALRAGRKILLGDRTIVTPAARDLGENQQVFVVIRPSM